MVEKVKYFYRVIYTHLSDDEYNEKNFRDDDLSVARANALNFLMNLSKELSEVSELEFSLQLEFIVESEGKLIKHILLDDEIDEEEIFAGRDFEKEVYKKLGLQEPE